MNLPEWIVLLLTAIGGAVFGGLILWLLLFPLRQYLSRLSERRKEHSEKLGTHFGDIRREVILRMSEMAGSLAIRHDRLVTSYAPIGDTYEFEKTELWKCFKLHFPEEAKEWEQLNEHAVEFNERLAALFRRYNDANAQTTARAELLPLQQDFGKFAQGLVAKSSNIEKYHVGFSYMKECPICQKF